MAPSFKFSIFISSSAVISDFSQFDEISGRKLRRLFFFFSFLGICSYVGSVKQKFVLNRYTENGPITNLSEVAGAFHGYCILSYIHCHRESLISGKKKASEPVHSDGKFVKASEIHQ